MRHVTTEEAAGMIEMAVEGRTQREIAEETGRNLRTVNKTIRTATKQIAEYKAAEYWEILGKYHNSLEAIAVRARDEYLGAPIGQADPRNAAAAITAIREDAKLLRLSEFVEEARKGKNFGSGQDIGIDLVGKTFGNEYWAVQCKCFSADTAISKDDVDSFLDGDVSILIFLDVSL